MKKEDEWLNRFRRQDWCQVYATLIEFEAAWIPRSEWSIIAALTLECCPLL
jgi:hypothetical protein